MAKCVVCKTKFKPKFSSLQKTCDIPCAIVHATEQNRKKIEKQRKKERQENRAAKIKLKTKSNWLDEAETAFRRWTRVKDRIFYAKQGKLPECISCGTNNPNIQYAAGHLKTKGSHPEFRLDPRNCNLQCNKRCNSELSGNINGTKDTHGYLVGLEIKYGAEEAKEIIEYLNTYRPLPNWTVDELKEIKQGFNAWARELENQLEVLNC